MAPFTLQRTQISSIERTHISTSAQLRGRQVKATSLSYPKASKTTREVLSNSMVSRWVSFWVCPLVFLLRFWFLFQKFQIVIAKGCFLSFTVLQAVVVMLQACQQRYENGPSQDSLKHHFYSIASSLYQNIEWDATNSGK